MGGCKAPLPTPLDPRSPAPMMGPTATSTELTRSAGSFLDILPALISLTLMTALRGGGYISIVPCYR